LLIRIYSIAVIVWGMLITLGPWIVGDHDSYGADMIISGLGLCVAVSGLGMLAHTLKPSESNAETLTEPAE
jgi:hypothetical protein